jgi:hypothetical protein
LWVTGSRAYVLVEQDARRVVAFDRQRTESQFLNEKPQYPVRGARKLVRVAG